MTFVCDENALRATIAALRERLLAARGPQGHWTGHLSSSALSTATAVFALALVDRRKHLPLIDRGLHWLCRNQNVDGGWGDTTQSPSNLSTTLLCYSAMSLPESPSACGEAVRKAESWLRRVVGTLEPGPLVKAVEQQYGGDRTFSVPILTMCALAGRLGIVGRAWAPKRDESRLGTPSPLAEMSCEDARPMCSGSRPGTPNPWRLVRALPFELAIFPHRLYKWLRLPVVSYALPALIAIGQARYEHLKPRNPFARTMRSLSRARSLRVLTGLQPENGGFLEAAPLTSFVVMSLASSGHRGHEVVSKGVEFLAASIREDGSWPIDTDLATWVTTLSIDALSAGGLDDALSPRERQGLTDWLLSCQYRSVHPYTHAEPGGWGWSNLPGAVPDADDTAGALLAVHCLGSGEGTIVDAASAGINWLLGLQNSDGGIPTFCRGWTKLPFDKSAPDITAHTLAAMGTWRHALAPALKGRTEKAMAKALGYLHDAQREEGSWVPLWFGNQSAPGQENPVYGTSRVLTHLSHCGFRIADCGFDLPSFRIMCEHAVQWLLSARNADGGWGGGPSVSSSVEETALAIDALATSSLQSTIHNPQSAINAVRRGADWLIRNTNEGRRMEASPIGLYFARLWYSEELYPIIFALCALGKVRRLANRPIVS